MVWKEIVADRVHGSGMTPSDFYKLVVEHNLHLITDGYEFKRGKAYFCLSVSHPKAIES
jgi:hypothetical protein